MDFLEFKLETVTDIFQTLAESWLNLTEEERSRYVREAERTNQGQQKEVNQNEESVIKYFI